MIFMTLVTSSDQNREQTYQVFSFWKKESSKVRNYVICFGNVFYLVFK